MQHARHDDGGGARCVQAAGSLDAGWAVGLLGASLGGWARGGGRWPGAARWWWRVAGHGTRGRAGHGDGRGCGGRASIREVIDGASMTWSKTLMSATAGDTLLVTGSRHRQFAMFRRS